MTSRFSTLFRLFFFFLTLWFLRSSKILFCLFFLCCEWRVEAWLSAALNCSSLCSFSDTSVRNIFSNIVVRLTPTLPSFQPDFDLSSTKSSCRQGCSEVETEPLLPETGFGGRCWFCVCRLTVDLLLGDFVCGGIWSLLKCSWNLKTESAHWGEKVKAAAGGEKASLRCDSSVVVFHTLLMEDRCGLQPGQSNSCTLLLHSVQVTNTPPYRHQVRGRHQCSTLTCLHLSESFDDYVFFFFCCLLPRHNLMDSLVPPMNNRLRSMGQTSSGL